MVRDPRLGSEYRRYELRQFRDIDRRSRNGLTRGGHFEQHGRLDGGDEFPWIEPDKV